MCFFWAARITSGTGNTKASIEEVFTDNATKKTSLACIKVSGETPKEVMGSQLLKKIFEKKKIIWTKPWASCSNFEFKPGLSSRLDYMAPEVPSNPILSMTLCLTLRHFVPPPPPHQTFALFCYFYLPSYTSFIPVSDSEFSSPFWCLTPPLCYTTLDKKRLVTYVQHCSSCPGQQLPPFQSLTCSFSTTKCPLCLGQHFKSFHLSNSTAHQFLREPLQLPSLNTLAYSSPSCHHSAYLGLFCPFIFSQ